jgi:hypothetical protein
MSAAGRLDDSEAVAAAPDLQGQEQAGPAAAVVIVRMI